jgi:hypothetical protein
VEYGNPLLTIVTPLGIRPGPRWSSFDPGRTTTQLAGHRKRGLDARSIPVSDRAAKTRTSCTSLSLYAASFGE